MMSTVSNVSSVLEPLGHLRHASPTVREKRVSKWIEEAFECVESVDCRVKLRLQRPQYSACTHRFPDSIHLQTTIKHYPKQHTRTSAQFIQTLGSTS